MNQFPVWNEETCGGCEEPQDEESKKDEAPFYKLQCTSSLCDYEGCHECMPNGRGSRCDDCRDPMTGE